MQLIDLFLHLDVHLAELTAQYGTWTYLILFAIVFCETGLVVTPFLPGDSLLFAAGAIAAQTTSTGEHPLDIATLCGLLIVAAVLGDTVNYHVGFFLGPKVLRGETSRFFNRKHLERTRQFFERYGGKTIILARFIPIIRTFAPFVAGVGAMNYLRFLAYNVIGALVWVLGFTLAGYWFAEMPIVKKNFSLVILAIIVISVMPGVYEFWRHRRQSAAAAAPPVDV